MSHAKLVEVINTPLSARVGHAEDAQGQPNPARARFHAVNSLASDGAVPQSTYSRAPQSRPNPDTTHAVRPAIEVEDERRVARCALHAHTAPLIDIHREVAAAVMVQDFTDGAPIVARCSCKLLGLAVLRMRRRAEESRTRAFPRHDSKVDR